VEGKICEDFEVAVTAMVRFHVHGDLKPQPQEIKLHVK